MAEILAQIVCDFLGFVAGEGYVIVPREPTAAMLKAARNAPSDLVWRDSLTAQMEADAANKYRAMIAAALEPTK